MPPTLFLEAFGQLSRDTSLAGIVSEEEDLYNVFDARAELMSWSTTSSRRRPLLWGINEAELTAGTDASRIGWVQVGLADVVEPAMALPALVQCFDDALRRFGAVELAAVNWFNTTQKGRADAIVAFNHELLGGQTEAELVASLQRRHIGAFEFGPVVAVPEQHSIKVPVETPWSGVSPEPSGLGLSVTLPEWTASAAGWVLANVIDAALASAPDVPNFAVRVTRVR